MNNLSFVKLDKLILVTGPLQPCLLSNFSRPLIAWLSIGSTYSYLTARRLEKKKKSENLDLLIKPFSIRNIMKAQNNIPFPPEKEEKTRYMWRDIERRAKKYGLPVPKTPVPYPLQEFDLANKIGLVANKEGWYLEYFRETYKVWFLEGKEAGSEQNLEETFKNLVPQKILDRDKLPLKTDAIRKDPMEQRKTNNFIWKHLYG